MNENREKYIKKIQPKKSLGKSIGLGIVIHLFTSMITTKLSTLVLCRFLGLIYATVLFAELCWLILIIFLVYRFLEKSNSIKRGYIAIIENQRVTSIDKIAESNHTTYEKSLKVINELIKKGAFENAYIDDAKREIVLPITNVDLHTQVLEKSIECPNCGATVTVYSHKENKCEYCGTALKF